MDLKLTKSQLTALMLTLIYRKVLIIVPEELQAKRMRLQLRKQLEQKYPMIYNRYNSAGYTIYINGYEPVAIHTPESCEMTNKVVFNGIVLTYGFREVPYIPYITEQPRELEEYLKAVLL